MSRYRIRLLLAKHPDDGNQPSVVACCDETIWDLYTPQMKAVWRSAEKAQLRRDGYEIREVWASFDLDAIADLFAEFECFAEIEAGFPPSWEGGN